MTLYQFLSALSEKKLNDPNGKYWLPNLLDEMKKQDGSKVLPLHIDIYDMGTLTGDVAKNIRTNIEASWLSAISAIARSVGIVFNPQNFLVIPDPDDPDPSLQFSDITIEGLSNVGIEMQQVEGEGTSYDTTAVLPLDYYEDKGTVRIRGNYRLRQVVCAADILDPTHPSKIVINVPKIQWPSQELVGEGQFLMEFRNSAFTMCLKTEAQGEETDRKLIFDLQQLEISGKEEGSLPELWLDKSALTIETILNEQVAEQWKNAVIILFESADVRSYVCDMLDKRLNNAKSDLSGRIHEVLGQYLDLSLGNVTGELPYDKEHACTNLVDRYLFDRIRYSVTNEEGTLYMPEMIKKLAPSELELGRIDIGKIEAGALELEQVYLDGTQIEGISSGDVDADTIYMDGERLHMKPYFTELKLSASLYASVFEDNLEGKISISIKNPQFAIISQMSAEGSAFKMQIQEITMQAQEDCITIQLSAESELLDLINSLLNSSQRIKKQFIQGINQELLDNHQKISDIVTEKLQSYVL